MNRFIPSRSRGFFSSVSLCLRGQSKPCLDAGGERAEVANSRDFVVRKLDVEVIFKAREQLKGLQAVDPQLLVEIVAGLKFCARNFELRRSEIQNFFGSLLYCLHVPIFP